MKQLLWALPLALLGATGCSSQANDTTATTEPVAIETPAANATDANATDANVTDAKAADANAADANAPDDAYRVTPAMPGLPAPAATALAKVKVPPPPKGMKVPDTARVRLETSKGPIVVELNGKAAPLHVKSFLYLSQRGFYDGTQFHRYEPDFVIQGGDPLSKSEETREFAGIGGPGYEIPREKNALAHEAMVIAAARSQDPDSAGSQFYFTLKPAPFLDEGDGYTVFGKVVEGEANVFQLRKGDTLKKVTVISESAK